MSDREKQSLRKQVEVLQTKITSLEQSNKDLQKQIEDKTKEFNGVFKAAMDFPAELRKILENYGCRNTLINLLDNVKQICETLTKEKQNA
jgi:uncharacterized protein YoxC